MPQTYVQTDLGRITHQYIWHGKRLGYTRRPIAGGPVEFWDGGKWVTPVAMNKAA
jgi:hypothetical protein